MSDELNFHYPLVVDPGLIDGAEIRINTFPYLSYSWAIRYADTPLVGQKRKRSPSHGAAYYEHRRSHSKTTRWSQQ